ncbi:antA/AntB antirepressor family protein [Bacillus sp. AG4(2022)]|uniref:antA/AntB antirepressor family protein n=1 Tax=Bacillus sp. AG4(2022) TaxID=2962594 RepID=UPI002880C0C5|nr:antA/AntB antirepressor family protein [Bacillus sp. AG4(2022)]MDT0163854.1 antA/AntB antirepressor family protein [Bacillus sp. AG4(2022)]
MEGLKIVANEMLPVYEGPHGEKFVDARELHEELMVGKDFTTWIKDRLHKYGFIEDEDFYLTLTKIGERKNVTKADYILKLDVAKEIAMVQNNEMGRAIRKYFIEVEKRFRDQQPKTQLEVLQASINQLVDQERRLSAVETRLIETEKKQDNITEILSLNPTEWRKKVNIIINKIANSIGGGQAFQDIRKESYQRLEERGNYKLSVRLTNKQRKMALEGVSKSRIDKVNFLDVIADDARLTEIYLSVVKEMAVKYQVEVDVPA